MSTENKRDDLIVTPDGKLRFAVTGIFGGGIVDKLDAWSKTQDSELLDRYRDNLHNYHTELFRMFRTPEEVDAYKLGITDGEGWHEHAYTSIDEHSEIYGVLQQAPEDAEPNTFNVRVFSSDTIGMARYSDIELHPCRETYQDGQCIVEQCDEQEADYWGVYLRLKSGGLECIADARDQQAAYSLARLLFHLTDLNLKTQVYNPQKK